MPFGSKFRGRGAGFQYEFVPDPSVFEKAYHQVGNNLEATFIPMQMAQQMVQKDIIQRFVTETDPAGHPWQQWSGSSIDFEDDSFGRAYETGYAAYALGYPNVGILRQDEELFHDAAREDRFRVTNDSVWYAAGNLPSAGMAHQKGAPHRRTSSGSPNPLPQRSFIGLSLSASTMILRMFGEWFDGSISLFVKPNGRIQSLWRGPQGARSSLGTFLPRL
jgi:hypothetical protein